MLGRTCRNRLLELERQLNVSLAEGGEVMNNITDIFEASNPDLPASLDSELANVLTELQGLFNKTQEITLLVNETTANLNSSVCCPADEYEEVLHNMTVKNQELRVLRDTIAILPPGGRRVRNQLIVFIRITYIICVGAQGIVIEVFVIVRVVFHQIDIGVIVVPGLNEEPVSTVSTTEPPESTPSSSSDLSAGELSTSGSPGEL